MRRWGGMPCSARKWLSCVPAARKPGRITRCWNALPGRRAGMSAGDGRTHQIRVHLASIKHPLAGDPVYGKAKSGDARLDAFRARRCIVATGLAAPGQRRRHGMGIGAAADFAALLDELRRGSFILPDWPAPPGVRALVTTRRGGVSRRRGTASISAPRRRRPAGGGGEPGAAAPRLARRAGVAVPGAWHTLRRCRHHGGRHGADASYTRQRAWCVPCHRRLSTGAAVRRAGRRGGIAHAGCADWRRRDEATVAAMAEPGTRLMAWLGPPSGRSPSKSATRCANSSLATIRGGLRVSAADDKWLCDIYQLACQRLHALGIRRVTSADSCSLTDAEHSFPTGATVSADAWPA